MPPPADDRRAVLLARVSSAEQAEGYSLDAQLGLLREYAERRGLVVVAEHRLAETATKRDRRKLFGGILASLRAKGAPRHLVVEKTDRLTRNLADFAAVEELRLSVGLRVHLVKEAAVIGPDANSQAMDTWELQAWLARRFSRNLSEEVRKGMKEKRRQGGWTHLAPLGLVNRTDGTKTWLEHDPDRAPIVREVFERVATERLTAAQAAALASEMGLRTRLGHELRPNGMAALLRHPILAGLVPQDGGWSGAKQAAAAIATRYERGSWEPVVPPATWHAVQDLLNTRVKRAGSRTEDVGSAPVFAGLLRCGACGRVVTTEVHHAKTRTGRYAYLRCSSGSKSHCGRVYAREDRVLEQVAERLGALSFDAALLPAVRAALLGASKAEAQAHREGVRRARDAQDRSRARVGAAVDAMVLGHITAAELAEVRRKAEAEQARASVQLAALASADSSWTDDAVLALGVVSAAGELFREAGPVAQRQLVGLLFEAPKLHAGRFEGAFSAPWSAVESRPTTRVLKDRKPGISRQNVASKRVGRRGAPAGPGVDRLVAAAVALRAHPRQVAALLQLVA